jgi:hypothetical protein
MSTTTTNSFTKDVFNSLKLDWCPHAQAREVLSGILFEEETLESIMEDIVFSLSNFLDYVRDIRNIPKVDKRVAPFFLITDESYCLHVGDDDDSKVIFVIIETEDVYLFGRSLDSSGVDHAICHDLEELKFCLILWFNEFYRKFEEGL